ncbi:hypothetical protein EUX98_g7607 [Antrodiella citrinella]|uniref:Poly [ADP-ribose] polymerase n=1 Tax=Antrodiella citrinella TaxID=2447956 RepID=A0A4V3XHT8_9APHY|nr:hypothetical protein EUX98_g7607 [Antrodiella citrinella]
MPPRKKITADASASVQPTRTSARNQAKVQATVAASAPAPTPTATTSAPKAQVKAPASNAKAASKAKVPVSRGKGKRLHNEDDEDEDKPEAKKVKSDDKVDDSDDEPAPAPKKMVTVVKRGAAPVDPCSGNVDTHQVLSTSDGVWDAMMNQTDVGANANKFYVIQVVHPIGNDNSCTLFTRWGRVGENGQQQRKGPFSSSVAVAEFKKQFKAKTSTNWEQRHGMATKKGKYTWLERDFEEDEPDKADSNGGGSSGAASKEPENIPDSALADEVQELCRIIFSTKFIDAHLSSMNYDANKLPLGKLAKGTILNGFAALKTLSEVISNPGSATATQMGGYRKAVEDLTGRYYSIIPHVFGRNRPTVIDSAVLLKRAALQELDLVDALGDMEIASKLISSSVLTDDSGKALNPIDAHFKSLRLTNMEHLVKTSQEFKGLEAYARDTHGSTHSYNVQLLNAYRVERQEETDAWNKAGFDGLKDGERLLLWHGSRTTNFAGILKQGLRIAPPEAPVTGYMFGKGVYFADIITKSAGYCYAHLSNGTGLLLLCEVAVKPFYELNNASYNAAQDSRAAACRATKGVGRYRPGAWQDAGDTLENETLTGVHMPHGKLEDGKDTTALMYNEYIVYDPAQIRVRYLLMVKM